MPQSYAAFLASYQDHDPLCPLHPDAKLTHECMNCATRVSADATACSYCRAYSCCTGKPECDQDGWHGPWSEPAGCMCEQLAEERRYEAAGGF